MDPTLRKNCTSGKIGESYSAHALAFRWNWWILICARAALQVERREVRSANALLFRWEGGILLCSCAVLQVKLVDLSLQTLTSSLSKLAASSSRFSLLAK